MITVSFTKLDGNGDIQHVGHIALQNGIVTLNPPDSMILNNVLGTAYRYNGDLAKWMEDLPLYYRSPYLLASEAVGEDAQEQNSSEEVSKDMPIGETRENIGISWPQPATGSESALATGPKSVLNQRTHRDG